MKKISPKRLHLKMSSAKHWPFCSSLNRLVHWGRVMHICISKLITIGSDNGLSPGWRQGIIWLLLIWTLGTIFSEILSEIHIFSFKIMHLKMSSGNRRPFCLSLNVLRHLHLNPTAWKRRSPSCGLCMFNPVGYWMGSIWITLILQQGQQQLLELYWSIRGKPVMGKQRIKSSKTCNDGGRACGHIHAIIKWNVYI